MRYYGFANFMLSSIQQGVQNFHVCHEMFNKYFYSSTGAAKVLHDWSTQHKTAIFLNGGNAAGLRSVYERLQQLGDELGLPYAKFHEDEQSLDNTMTACGIVVPEYIVDMMPIVRFTPADWTTYDEKWPGPVQLEAIELAMYLNSFQLAR